MYFFIVNPYLQDISYITANYLGVLSIFALLLPLPSLAVHFLYRYNIICCTKKWSIYKFTAVFCFYILWITTHCLLLANVKNDNLESFIKEANEMTDFNRTAPKFFVLDMVNTFSKILNQYLLINKNNKHKPSVF